MNLNLLAWRNLWRHKRRTFITASSIAFGVILAFTLTGTNDDYNARMIDAGASMGMGHITITAIDYNRAPSLKKRLKNVNIIREKSLNQFNFYDVKITDAMIRISGKAMFASANKSIGGQFIAIDPEQESKHSNLFLRSIISGSVFKNLNKSGVVVGVKLAEKLHLKIGKKLVYTTADAQGEIVSSLERVTGIFKTGVLEIDSTMVILPLGRVRETLNYQPDEASMIALMLNNQRKTEFIKNTLELNPLYSDSEVLSWEQSQPELATAVNMNDGFTYVMEVLIALLIAAGILNTVLMSVLERRHEFGIMMAVGMQPFTLFRLVMIESFWLAIFGLIIGCIVSTPWYFYMHDVGIDLTAAYGDDMDMGGVVIEQVMKIQIFKESIIAILIVLFSLSLSAGAYPAWRAGRIPPVIALKGN